MRLNFKIRKQNIVFIIQICFSIMIPILSYTGLSGKDITSWNILANLLKDSLKNPYILVLILNSVIISVLDPTTPGIRDSEYVVKKEELNETLSIMEEN